MNLLSIPSRNHSRGKHPPRKSGAITTSPTVACLYSVLAIGLVVTLFIVDVTPAENWWVLGFFAAFQLVLMLLAVPTTAFGATTKAWVSLDHAILVTILMLFQPLSAACASGGAALVFSLIINRNQGAGWRVLIHACGNGAMYLLMTLAAGYVWLAVGGTIPIENFGLVNIDRIAVTLITLQGVNEVMIVTLKWRRPIFWPATLLEFAIAWTGVATALVFFDLSASSFGLYAGLILIVAVLLKYAVGITESSHRRTRELAAINRVNQAVDVGASLKELLDTILQETKGLMGFAAFVIGLHDAETNEIVVYLNYDNGVHHPVTRRKTNQGVIGWVFEQGQSASIGDTRTSKHPSLRQRLVTGEPSISILGVPIVSRGKTIGAMSAQDYYPNAFGQSHLKLLEGFAQQIAVAIINTNLFEALQKSQQELEERVASRTQELEQASISLRQAVEQKEGLLERLEQENRRDVLTHLANRRHLGEVLRQEHYRAKRFDHAFSIAIGDIDHFKRINDNWGHMLGDEVLNTLADILRAELRVTDFPARYGGEEFVIVFPETDFPSAMSVCENLRVKIESHPWNKLAAGLEVTMSFGVCDNKSEAKGFADILARADQALYRAKSGGRNRVEGFTDRGTDYQAKA